jgi:hypothetical protein
MDFGAGEFMDRPSSDRRMRGTPLYLAPELFERAPASVATDVYAVGVLLFYLVTGGFPVTGSSIEALRDAHRRGERRRLRDERPDLPDSFVSVVERALDRDPARRFASAGEMHAALGGAEPKPLGATSIWRALERVALTAAIVLVVSGVIGFLASRLFENALRIDRAFTVGVADYVLVGLRAIVPFVIVWTAVAASIAVVTGLRPLIGNRFESIRRRLALDERLDPSTQASVLVLVGIVGLVWLTWRFWDVYLALTALAVDPHPADLDLSILGWPGRDIHRRHAQVASALTFILGIAVWFWFPWLKQRAADPERVRQLRAAAVVILLLVVAKESITRPFLWDRREIVMFKTQRVFVIGANDNELLLFNPEKGQRTYQRVRLDAPDLQRNVDARPLFLEGPGPVRP